jgi:hypothetical protein
MKTNNKMNATELFLKDGKPTGIFFCEKCRQIACTHDSAERCCKNYLCTKCGVDTGQRSWTACEPCRRAAEAEGERARFEKAEKLTKWDGWVDDGSDYYPSVGAYLESRDSGSGNGDVPEYVWACKAIQIVKVDSDHLMQEIEEHGYEDFDSSTLDGLAEFETACKAFEKANADVVSYEPDYTRAVLLSPQTSDLKCGEV